MLTLAQAEEGRGYTVKDIKGIQLICQAKYVEASL